MADYATVYMADPSLMGSKLFNRIVGVRSYDGRTTDGSATGVRFELDAGEVTMNFMPDSRVQQHLADFSGFVEQTIEDRDRRIYVLSRIRYVRLVCGCVVTPGFDEDGSIAQFLFDFNSAVNGLLVWANTIFDHDGEALGGEHGDR